MKSHSTLAPLAGKAASAGTKSFLVVSCKLRPSIGDLGPDQKLFLNIHPRTISDPHFVRGETMRLIGEMGLKPSSIVFEITERHCIKDFPNFNKTLEHYRSQGYMVAVDDAGSGFSSLQSIAEIRPDFIKIDMSLVRDINLNSIKRVLLETFINFAEKNWLRHYCRGH